MISRILIVSLCLFFQISLQVLKPGLYIDISGRQYLYIKDTSEQQYQLYLDSYHEISDEINFYMYYNKISRIRYRRDSITVRENDGTWTTKDRSKPPQGFHLYVLGREKLALSMTQHGRKSIRFRIGDDLEDRIDLYSCDLFLTYESSSKYPSEANPLGIKLCQDLARTICRVEDQVVRDIILRELLSKHKGLAKDEVYCTELIDSETWDPFLSKKPRN